MKQPNPNAVLSYASIVLIFILSFRAFAGFLTPDFDSDQAIHVLMAYDLRLPEDLYYWGQSRLGSLLPILSHWLLKITSLTSIEAVSYVQYGFVGVGFFCFVSLFKKLISKVVFSLVWFLPPNPFLKLVEVAHPYAPQFALLGIALVSTNQLVSVPETKTLKKLALSLLILFSFILSIWVSDLSLVPAFLAGVWIFKRFLEQRHNVNQPLNSYQSVPKLIRANLIYVSIFFGLLLGGAFLIYAKSNAQADQDYGFLALNNLEILVHVARSMLAAIVRTLGFQIGNFWLSLYAIASLASIAVLTGCFLQGRHNPQFNTRVRWIPFFLTSAIATLALILLSRWTYIQETPSRYFIGIYLFCWLSALLVFDNLDTTNLFNRTILNRISALLVLTALLGSLSLPNYVFAIEKAQSRLSLLQPLTSLGEVGFIGDYWASYLMCIVAPERLNCTPHEQDFVRCSRCVKQVLDARLIYLIDRDWLDSFPEEVVQFGQRLRKQQSAQKIAGYWMAPYRKIQ